LAPEQPAEAGPPGPPAPPPGLPAGATGMRKYMDDDTESPEAPQGQPPVSGSGNVLPDPSEEDIKKYNLDIKDFEQEMDEEEIDASEL
jgi:hypothetical protein